MKLLWSALFWLQIALPGAGAAAELPFEMLVLSGKAKDHNGAVRRNNPFATGFNVRVAGSSARFFNSFAELKTFLKTVTTPSRIAILITAHGGPGGSAVLNSGAVYAPELLATARQLTKSGSRVAILSQACYSGDLITKLVAQDLAAKAADERLCVVTDSHPNRTALSVQGLVPDTLVMAKPGQNLHDLYRIMSGGLISSAKFSETRLDEFFDARLKAGKSPVAFDVLLAGMRSVIDRLESRPHLRHYSLSAIDQTYAPFEMGAYQQLAEVESSVLDRSVFENSWTQLNQKLNLPACLQSVHARVGVRAFTGGRSRIPVSEFFKAIQAEIAGDSAAAAAECSSARLEQWYANSVTPYYTWKRAVWRALSRLNVKFDASTPLDQLPVLSANLSTPLSAEIHLENIFRGKVGSDVGGNPWFAFAQASLQSAPQHERDHARFKGCEDFRF